MRSESLDAVRSNMAPTVTDTSPLPTFPALDSLRGLASVAVVATHASFWAGAYNTSAWGTALARLDVGVALFFVLSGFLLSRPWFEQRRRGLPAPGAGRYLWKRVLRIVPVYVVAVVAALTLLPGNRDAGIDRWVTTLFMANIYVDDQLPDGLSQMWSLATEVAFYLLLPVLMYLVLRPRAASAGDLRRFGVLLVVMLGVNVVWLLDLSVRLDQGGSMIRLWLPSYLTWFGAGLVIAAAHVRVRHEVAPEHGTSAWLLQQLGRSPATCWVAALALFAIAATPLAGPADLTPATLSAALTKNLLYVAIAALVVLPGVFAGPDHAITRVLSLRPLRHLGLVSYGLFCVHLVVLELVVRWRDIELFGGHGWELFALTLVLSLLVSELLYRLMEKPLMRLKNLGWRSSETTSAPTANATSS